MRRTFTAVAITLTSLTAAGCFPRPYGQNGDQTFKSSGLALKNVQSKREPVYLIAFDGTECTVSKERFAKIQPGESALCVWRTP